MTKSTITRERIQRIIRAINSEAYDEEEIREWLSSDEIMELSRMALAAMASESGCLPLDYLQGHKDGLEWASQLAEANHPETGDWLYDDPIELAKAIRKGPDMPPAQLAPVVPPEQHWEELCRQHPDMSIGDAIIRAAWWNHCRAAMLERQLVDRVDEKSLTSINPAPDLVSLQKKAESIIGNYPGIPDGSEHCPCCGKKLRRACSVEGCGGKHVAHGLCQKHYDMKRWEDPEQVERFREADRRYRGKKKTTVTTPQEPKP